MTTEPSSHPPIPSPSDSSLQAPASLPPPSSALSSPPPTAAPLKQPSSSSSQSRRHSLRFSFPPLFSQPFKTSSTSVVSSTAEGKPIPVDDSTAAHRTSALRELNSTYPSPVSRHRYAKTSGAQNSTYSQPVIVRTYSGPPPSQAHSRSNSAGYYQPPSTSRAGSQRVPYSATSTSTSYLSPGAVSKPIRATQNGGVLNMGRGNVKKKLPWSWQTGPPPQQDETKLPPLEAFSFKSFMADLQAQGGESDIGADLDRIAEICARSRYSLSNQYEVHVAPHGSGQSFVATAVPASSGRRRANGRGSQNNGGLTLQAIQSDDDESSARSHRKRRSGGRRRSVAYGTLETIMSSSRSSEEDKSKKKPAAEIAEGIRGRGRKGSSSSKASGSGSRSPRTGTTSSDPAAAGPSEPRAPKELARKKSTSFANAIIHADSTRYHGSGELTSPRGSAAALVSEPALPQTSNSHLEIRTAPDDIYATDYPNDTQPQSPQGSADSDTLYAQGLAVAEEPSTAGTGLLSGLSSWMPWKGTTSGTPGATSQQKILGQPSHAAGTLRDLLKNVDDKHDKQDKGKAVDRTE